MEAFAPFDRGRQPRPLAARTELHRAGALALLPLSQRRDDRPQPGRQHITLAALLDEDGREINPQSSVSYDTLVVAVGSITNDFGTPGAKGFSVPLETPEAAARFNRRLVSACLRAQNQSEPILPGQLHVAIIGAGATGTELAAVLH